MEINVIQWVDAMNRSSINKSNQRRGKTYERRVAAALGGVRNLDKSRPHTDVEDCTYVWEVKTTQAKMPQWLVKAFNQLELASKESKKVKGGVVRVHTKEGRKSRAFIINEISLEEQP